MHKTKNKRNKLAKKTRRYRKYYGGNSETSTNKSSEILKESEGIFDVIGDKLSGYTSSMYNYGKEKVILRRGEKGSGNPEIFLAEKTNDLIVRIKLQGEDNSISKFEDIIPFVLLLASEKSSFSNGSLIPINGGA